ncbi:MAG: FAD:protein FMN transferase [Pirellulaceae bacterium]
MSDPQNNSRRDFITGESLRSKIEDRLNGRAGAESAQEAETRKPENLFLQHFSRNAMACEFQVFWNLLRSDNFGAAAIKALGEVDRIETLFSIFRADSELSRVNEQAAVDAQLVSSETFDVFTLALQIWRDTQGAFDIASTPLTRAWGFFDRKPRVPDEAAIAKALESSSSRGIVLDPVNQTVHFKQPNLEVNFHSIGKGFALDQMASRIVGLGFDEFIVHGGQSSVVARVSDPAYGTVCEWPVALTHPLFPSTTLGTVFLTNESLATSGSARQAIIHRGERLSHVIDPRTGWPTNNFLSVTVIHPRAAVSDALATAFNVMKWEEILSTCRLFPEAKVIAITENKSSLSGVELKQHNVEPDQILLSHEES